MFYQGLWKSETQCYENIAFYLPHTPDNEFSRRLLSCLVFFPFIICTQVSIQRVVHLPVHLPCTHRTPAKDRHLGWELLGTQRWVTGWAWPLPCSCLGHIHHHTTKIQKQRKVVTIHWEGWTTKLIKTHLYSLTSQHQFSLLSLNNSENNIKLWICQLIEPST